MNRIKYPTVEDVIETNRRVLELHPVKKADKHGLLGSRGQIQKIINSAKKKKGTVEEKAIVLFKGLLRHHIFESGNRRTAYLVMNNFLWKNRNYAILKEDNKKNLRFINRVRQHRYDEKEIKKWLR